MLRRYPLKVRHFAMGGVPTPGGVPVSPPGLFNSFGRAPAPAIQGLPPVAPPAIGGPLPASGSPMDAAGMQQAMATAGLAPQSEQGNTPIMAGGPGTHAWAATHPNYSGQGFPGVGMPTTGGASIGSSAFTPQATQFGGMTSQGPNKWMNYLHAMGASKYTPFGQYKPPVTPKIGPPQADQGITGANDIAYGQPVQHFSGGTGGGGGGGGIGQYKEMINNSAAQYGIDPALMEAIFIQETGWGKSSDWRNYNNPGGIGGPGAGPSRVYNSPQAGFNAMASLIARRYGGANADPKQMASRWVGMSKSANNDWAHSVNRLMRRFGDAVKERIGGGQERTGNSNPGYLGYNGGNFGNLSTGNLSDRPVDPGRVLIGDETNNNAPGYGSNPGNLDHSGAYDPNYNYGGGGATRGAAGLLGSIVGGGAGMMIPGLGLVTGKLGGMAGRGIAKMLQTSGADRPPAGYGPVKDSAGGDGGGFNFNFPKGLGGFGKPMGYFPPTGGYGSGDPGNYNPTGPMGGPGTFGIVNNSSPAGGGSFFGGDTGLLPRGVPGGLSMALPGSFANLGGSSADGRGNIGWNYFGNKSLMNGDPSLGFGGPGDAVGQYAMFGHGNPGAAGAIGAPILPMNQWGGGGGGAPTQFGPNNRQMSQNWKGRGPVKGYSEGGTPSDDMTSKYLNSWATIPWPMTSGNVSGIAPVPVIPPEKYPQAIKAFPPELQLEFEKVGKLYDKDKISWDEYKKRISFMGMDGIQTRGEYWKGRASTQPTDAAKYISSGMTKTSLETDVEPALISKNEAVFNPKQLAALSVVPNKKHKLLPSQVRAIFAAKRAKL